VRREEHRLAARLRFDHRFAKDPFHQRVEAARRLVENQKVGAGCRRCDELDLLAVSLRERTHLLRRVELEALDELFAVGAVRRPVQVAQIGERLGAGEARPERRLAGDVGDAPVGRDRVAPQVPVEEFGTSCRRTMQAEQQSNRRRLARAVRPEVPLDLTGLDGEVERI
jgi:hypothetical protein